jgi:hypothetical protein
MTGFFTAMTEAVRVVVPAAAGSDGGEIAARDVPGARVPAQVLLDGVAPAAERAERRDEGGSRRLLLELASLPGELRLDGELTSLRTFSVVSGPTSVALGG